MLSGAQMQMQSDSQHVVRQTVMAKWRWQWRLRLRWRWRWQRCECSTTTAASGSAVVLSQRHLPHEVAPETRRRRLEVPTMWMKQLAKQNAEKCYGNGNCVGVGGRVCVGVWVSVGCCWARYTKSVCSMGHYWVVYGSNGCLPFPPLPHKPMARCCDAKRTFKFSTAGTSECCRRAVGQVLFLQANLKSVTRWLLKAKCVC